MHLWFKQAGVPGRITRLLSAGGGDHLGEHPPPQPSPLFALMPVPELLISLPPRRL